MSQDKYFRTELSFLKEQSLTFAKLHPKLTRFLDSRNTDPDVERLLEGFAFLTGRLREKIEDEFPELTHSMINMLWPNYLRPVPSMSIIQFKLPMDNSINQKHSMPKGIRLTGKVNGGGDKDKQEEDSSGNSKKDDFIHCPFYTCRSFDIYPLTRESVKATHTREASTIDIILKNSDDSIDLSAMDLRDLRFFLGDDQHSARTLYLWLNHYLAGIEIIGRNVQGQDRVYSLPKQQLKPVGFDCKDAILPYPKNVYEGYRVLQEYLSYEQAFLFFDICNIHQFILPDLVDSFTLRLKFTNNIPPDVRINERCFELYCVPAINLFPHDSNPIHLDGKSTQYRLMPVSRDPAHFEIFSVDKVESFKDQKDSDKPSRMRGHKRTYFPFESFDHEIERSRNRNALYYRVRVKESLHEDGFDHFLSFVRADETENVGRSESISIQLTCTNRQLPTQLGIDGISGDSDALPSFVQATNITKPTDPLRPILDGSLLWILISNLSLNYLSLLSKNALSCVLRAYDFKSLVDRQAERVAKQRLNGIVDITTQPLERIVKGLPVRGLRSEITLDQSAFSGEGDLYLFGTVLSNFFALYASINSFHELVVINSKNQEKYTWGMKTGLQPVI